MRNREICVLVGSALAIPSAAVADINGFGNFPSSDWSINVDDGAAGPSTTFNRIHLTNQVANESRSIFNNTPQSIGQFTASFIFQATGAQGAQPGACFVLQNSPAGAHTVAGAVQSGVATKFGYFDEFGAFHLRSLAISIEHGTVSAGSSSTSLYTNGSVGGGSTSTSPVDFFSGNPIQFTISYDGSQIHEHAVDTVTQMPFDISFPINIPSIVAASTAFVGFTAASSTNTTLDQYFSDLQFHAVPAPAALPMLSIAGVALTRRRR